MARGYFNYFNKTDYLFSDGVRKSVTNLSKYTAFFSKIADNTSYYNFYQVQPNDRLDTISYKLYNTTEYYWTIPLLNTNIINLWDSTYLDTRVFERYVQEKYAGLALFAHPTTPIPGQFRSGELVAFNIETTATVVRTYPSLNYVHVIPSPSDFNPLDLGDTWVLLTGLWNEEPRNIWDDHDVWKDNIFHLIGIGKGSIEIESIIPFYLAPAYFQDVEGNIVVWNSPVEKTPVTWSDLERERNEEKSRIKVLRPEYVYEVARDFEREMKRQ